VTALLVLFALFVGQVSFWSTGWYSMTGTAIGCAALIVWSAWPRRQSLGSRIPVIGREETVRMRRVVRT